MTDAPADAPEFDPLDFPSDLVKAQREAVEAREELRRFAATLPWSREPHEGWEAPEQTGGMRGFSSARPATQGWTEEQTAEYERLWEECRKKSAKVYAHAHWGKCGSRAYEARQALKRKPEAQPVVKAETPEPAQEDMALTR